MQSQAAIISELRQLRAFMAEGEARAARLLKQLEGEEKKATRGLDVHAKANVLAKRRKTAIK